MRSFLSDVDLNFLVRELDFCQHPVGFACLRDFDVANAVLLEFLQEQVDVHRTHRSVLVSDLLLKVAVDELLRNTLNNLITLPDVVHVVFDIEEAGNWREFDSALDFLWNDTDSDFWVNEDLTLLALKGKFDAFAALECDNLFGLVIGDGNF